MVVGTVLAIQAGVFQVVHPFNAGMDGPNTLFAHLTSAIVMGRLQMKFLVMIDSNVGWDRCKRSLLTLMASSAPLTSHGPRCALLLVTVCMELISYPSFLYVLWNKKALLSLVVSK